MVMLPSVSSSSLVDGNKTRADQMMLPTIVIAKDACKVDVPEEFLAATHEYAVKHPAEYRDGMNEAIKTMGPLMGMACLALSTKLGDLRSAVKEYYAMPLQK
jgi:hypothetical protein